MNIDHIPVMRGEVVEALQVKESGVYVDATVGLGGHAEAILRSAACTVIGMDRDEGAIGIAGERLSSFSGVHLLQEPFSNITSAVQHLGFEKVDGILMDLGVSTMQLKAEGRGFSFLRDEPLDMRMDTGQDLTAEKVVNSYREKDLAHIIWKYGEERYSRRIAKAIVGARRRERITSCLALASLIEKSIRGRGRIHPATRTFQALRIEVNRELQELELALDQAPGLLRQKGRLCVMSYHSLEDRIVKNAFRELAREGIFNIITRKPLVPSREEQIQNPSSRSAKLRIGEML
jgi:16S rRNA (cytosine1402-N4)-methyltransferase